MTAPEPLTLDHFRPTLGTAYGIDLGAPGRLNLTLAVADGRGDPPSPEETRRQPFSLEFVGPLDPQLVQATYVLVHEELGELHVFLVPIAREPEGMRYQAIFG